jgi:prophage antirepressor-like protein
LLFNYQSDEENAFNQIRTIEEDGKLWFCATDVARVLGYVNPRDAIIRYCKSMGVVIRVCCTTSLKEEYFLEQLALNY